MAQKGLSYLLRAAPCRMRPLGALPTNTKKANSIEARLAMINISKVVYYLVLRLKVWTA